MVEFGVDIPPGPGGDNRVAEGRVELTGDHHVAVKHERAGCEAEIRTQSLQREDTRQELLFACGHEQLVVASGQHLPAREHIHDGDSSPAVACTLKPAREVGNAGLQRRRGGCRRPPCRSHRLGVRHAGSHEAACNH